MHRDLSSELKKNIFSHKNEKCHLLLIQTSHISTFGQCVTCKAVNSEHNEMGKCNEKLLLWQNMLS
jgi:hypothetical protein